MNRRGQLVLVAAAIIAVGLVPMLTAYLQLGYDADVRTTADDRSPSEDAVRALDGAVHNASAGVPASYDWSERSDAVDEVRSQLAPRIDTVETALVERGVARSVAYNATLANDVAGADCPNGPDRQFGSCVADRGVVVQDRDGETHVLAVAFDVGSTTDRGESRVTVLVRPW